MRSFEQNKGKQNNFGYYCKQEGRPDSDILSEEKEY